MLSEYQFTKRGEEQLEFTYVVNDEFELDLEDGSDDMNEDATEGVTPDIDYSEHVAVNVEQDSNEGEDGNIGRAGENEGGVEATTTDGDGY